MILSRAISISRKRSSLALLLVLFCMPLFAASYRVGVAAGFDDPSFFDLIGTASSFSSAFVEDPVLAADAVSRDREKALREYEVKVAEAVRGGKEVPEFVQPDLAGDYVVEFVPLDIPDEQIAFVEKGDAEAVGYLKMLNDLDELMFFSRFQEGSVEELVLHVDGVFEDVFFAPLDGSGYFLQLANFFLKHWKGGGYSIVRMDGNVPYTVMCDGSALELYDRYCVFEDGSHVLVLSYADYRDLEVVLETPVSSGVYFSLEELPAGPLFISSVPYSSDVRLNGVAVESGFVGNAALPLSVSAVRPGYETRTVNSAGNPGVLEMTLLPSPLYEPGYLETAKKDFYSNLLFTLASFGAGVALGFVNGIYQLDHLVPLETLAAGVSVFQLIRTIDSLFKYRDALSLGV